MLNDTFYFMDKRENEEYLDCNNATAELKQNQQLMIQENNWNQ